MMYSNEDSYTEFAARVPGLEVTDVRGACKGCVEGEGMSSCFISCLMTGLVTFCT